jgi:hypothetical protein
MIMEDMIMTSTTEATETMNSVDVSTMTAITTLSHFKMMTSMIRQDLHVPRKAACGP